ncbi:hypothetical protein [Streptomyces catenulae]|uniref:Histone protein n=1 Tax=Streptomyces catenulae TaxID=66875 RepID=A0ABV2YSS2_9ACTN|nr:hypothetical protein [Streptomyces catenulae]
MDDCTKVSLIAAVAAGYLLGRTKKGRLAIGLASLIAGRQLPVNPREAVGLVLQKLAQDPQLAPLVEQARGEMLEAGRTALSATANRRLEAVADALEQRTNTLLEPPETEDDDEAEDTADEEPEDEERDVEAEREEADAPRRRPKKRPAAAAKKGSATKAPAKKAPAKKAAARKSAPEKAAAKKRPSRVSRRR